MQLKVQVKACILIFAASVFIANGPLIAGDYYYDEINKAHESSHKANEQIRLKSSFPNCAGFRLPSGKVFDLPEPSLSLDDFIYSLSSNEKGSLFDYYFLEMGNHWKSKPSYVWDEWVGFLFGAKKELELLADGKKSRSTTKQLKEFTRYGSHLCNLVKKRHPENTGYQAFCNNMQSQSESTLTSLNQSK
jgi:hypothetical protein